jgi:hypothetical protein
MRTFINSRAMAMTLALQTVDDRDWPAPHRARRRVRRTSDANADERHSSASNRRQ